MIFHSHVSLPEGNEHEFDAFVYHTFQAEAGHMGMGQAIGASMSLAFRKEFTRS
jgi:hypothetical protein